MTALRALAPGHGAAFQLEDDAAGWTVYIDGPAGKSAQYRKDTVSSPSLDGRALRFILTGGDPYVGVLTARSLPPQPEATAFELGFWWQYTPPTTFDNRGGPSRVQALEWAMDLWTPHGRFEWAAQWDNVLGDNGAGKPQWRLWTGTSWQGMGLTQMLAANRWHYFQLRGAIVAGQVHYARMISDKVSRPLHQHFPPTSLTGNYVPQVSFQLDGNAQEQPYTVYFDKVSLRWYPVRPW